MATRAKKTSSPSELQIALDNRAFEIMLFWQRSNYFLVLITALGIGTFSIKDPEFSFLTSVAASVSSFFWFKTNLGSRFWQESWEAEVVLLAKEIGIRSFERPMQEIVLQVQRELESSKNRSVARRWVDRQILKKPSVSYHMIKLSMASIVLWVVVSFIFGWKSRVSISLHLNQAFTFLSSFLPTC